MIIFNNIFIMFSSPRRNHTATQHTPVAGARSRRQGRAGISGPPRDTRRQKARGGANQSRRSEMMRSDGTRALFVCVAVRRRAAAVSDASVSAPDPCTGPSGGPRTEPCRTPPELRDGGAVCVWLSRGGCGSYLHTQTVRIKVTDEQRCLMMSTAEVDK